MTELSLTIDDEWENFLLPTEDDSDNEDEYNEISKDNNTEI